MSTNRTPPDYAEALPWGGDAGLAELVGEGVEPALVAEMRPTGEARGAEPPAVAAPSPAPAPMIASAHGRYKHHIGGMSSSPLTESLEVARTHAVVADALLDGTLSPQMVIRVGWHSGAGTVPPLTPRRALDEQIER